MDSRKLTEGEVADMLAIEAGLTIWEMDFIEAMHALVRNGGSSTARQTAKVRELWDRHCR